MIKEEGEESCSGHVNEGGAEGGEEKEEELQNGEKKKKRKQTEIRGNKIEANDKTERGKKKRKAELKRKEPNMQ